MSKPIPIIPNHVPPKPRPPLPKSRLEMFSDSQDEPMFEHVPLYPRPVPQPKPKE